jgi:hypothetical protein
MGDMRQYAQGRNPAMEQIYQQDATRRAAAAPTPPMMPGSNSPYGIDAMGMPAYPKAQPAQAAPQKAADTMIGPPTFDQTGVQSARMMSARLQDQIAREQQDLLARRHQNKLVQGSPEDQAILDNIQSLRKEASGYQQAGVMPQAPRTAEQNAASIADVNAQTRSILGNDLSTIEAQLRSPNGGDKEALMARYQQLKQRVAQLDTQSTPDSPAVVARGQEVTAGQQRAFADPIQADRRRAAYDASAQLTSARESANKYQSDLTGATRAADVDRAKFATDELGAKRRLMALSEENASLGNKALATNIDLSSREMGIKEKSAAADAALKIAQTEGVTLDNGAKQLQLEFAKKKMPFDLESETYAAKFREAQYQAVASGNAISPETQKILTDNWNYAKQKNGVDAAASVFDSAIAQLRDNVGGVNGNVLKGGFWTGSVASDRAILNQIEPYVLGLKSAAAANPQQAAMEARQKLSQMPDLTESGSTLGQVAGRVGSSAAVGAGAGSFILPGVGTLVGAGVGTLAGVANQVFAGSSSPELQAELIRYQALRETLKQIASQAR